jgi:hypothetical protein
MRIRLVERGSVVSCEGPLEDVLVVLALLGAQRISLCSIEGSAAACWSSE